MNPKIEKLKAERSRNTEKISDLQNRNRKLSEQITKLENNDIIGMVREIGMTPEQLAAPAFAYTGDSTETAEQQSSASQTTVQTERIGTVTTNGGRLNLRDGASTSYNIIGQLPCGDTVTVIGEENGWYKVICQRHVFRKDRQKLFRLPRTDGRRAEIQLCSGI